MNDTTDDLRLIADSAERLFSEQVDKAVREQAEQGQLDAALWARVAEAGFPLLLATEAAGGFGAGWAAAYPLLRGLGHWQVPLPLAETMVAAQLLSAAGLPVPDGPLTLVEQGRGNRLVADGPAAAPRLSGSAHHVPWARSAVAAAVALADGRVALLPLKAGADAAPGAPQAAGVQLQPHANPALLPSDTLQLQQAACQAAAPLAWGLAQPAWTLGALARSAMAVGALEWVLAQSVQYVGERVQFGKPIGKNQAIQQALALLAGDVAATRMAALVAMGDAPVGAALPGTAAACAFSAAVAKVRAGEAATRATNTAHQVHGAIGFTREHALHFATRRLWAWREEFGSDAEWARALGQAAIARRAAGFWPALAQRQLWGAPA